VALTDGESGLAVPEDVVRVEGLVWGLAVPKDVVRAEGEGYGVSVPKEGVAGAEGEG